MDKTDAIQILQALAEGKHPDTHRLLPPENVLQEPRVIRALFISVDELKKAVAAEGAVPVPLRQGKPWDDIEDSQLKDEFINQKLPVGQMAARHQRSRGGITSRLVRLGLIDPKHQHQLP